jgi:penicillin-binding protein 1C
MNSFRVVLKYTVALLFVIILSYIFIPKPDLKTFKTYSSAIYDSNDSLLRITLSKDEKFRIYESIDNISREFLKTTILYEDKNFYNNRGVDFIALVRAFWKTYILQERRIGASTIAMQVARLRWQISSNNIPGKIVQIFRAIQISRHYTKNQILEFYVNFASYGANIEGIGAASLIYFNKKPSELNFVEILTLSVIPQNPNKRNPMTNKGYMNLLKVRNNLFEKWVKINPSYIKYKKYLDMPIKVRKLNELPFHAPHFTNYIENQYAYWDHGKIKTTLDLQLQNQIENIVSNYINSKINDGIKNASVLLVDHNTMEIKSMVGSADFFNNKIQGQVNGTTAKRSPGSTLKPFVYALAMDEGIIHPLTLMKDAPRLFGGFTPENYDKKFLGPILAKDALVMSRNVPAVNLQSKLTKKSFYNFLSEAGVSKLKNEDFYGLTLSLGGVEMTMLELAELYGLLANSGKLKKISSINTLPTTKEEKISLISPESAFLTLDILKDNPAPNNLNFDVRYLKKNEVAWKTGTSWAFRDAWSIAISKKYILVVWVGNFKGKGNSSFVGRTGAGPLLFSILDAIDTEKNWKVSKLFKKHNLNIKSIKVCAKTGDLETKYCPSQIHTWFIPGVSPIKTSSIYRAIPISKDSGLRACTYNPAKNDLKVYEFWSSDFLEIFNQARINIAKPPKYENECSLNQKSIVGQTPIINSPQDTHEYVISSETKKITKIPFKVVVDSDVNKVFWFVNGKYVGKSNRGMTFLWQATSGSHQVRAVDDSGRAAVKNFNVIQY